LKLKNEDVVKFSKINYFENPYKYCQITEVFSQEVADSLLNWLESIEFTKKEEEFYRNSWFNISSEVLPDNLKLVFSHKNLKKIKSNVEKIFGVTFTEDMLIFGQKYEPGEGTLIHTDYMEPTNRNYQYFFTHRMIVYLNHGWEEKQGGLFGVFSSSDPKDIISTFEPIHNTAVSLSHGPSSYHAVSSVNEGIRYAIQFSFLSKELKYEGE